MGKPSENPLTSQGFNNERNRTQFTKHVFQIWYVEDPIGFFFLPFPNEFYHFFYKCDAQNVMLLKKYSILSACHPIWRR